MTKWTYTKTYHPDGATVGNQWLVMRDRQPVGQIEYTSHSGGGAFHIWTLPDRTWRGTKTTLPEALNAVRDALA